MRGFNLRGNASMFGVMVAVVLVVGLTLVYLFGGFGNKAENQRADKVGETVVGQSIARAKDSKCMDNLRQVRQALELARIGEDEPPQSLTELKLPAEMLADPIGGEPYEYDSEAGTVECKHPGHEKY